MPFLKRPAFHHGPFGSCCEDLKHCMSQPNALIRETPEKSLFFAIGYMETEQGIGWFDHAIMYCPFAASSFRIARSYERKQRLRHESKA